MKTWSTVALAANSTVLSLTIVGSVAALMADEGIVVQHTSPKEPLPVNGNSSTITNRTSAISVPIRISLADLANRLNSTVPAEIKGDGPINVPGANGGSHATYTVHREGFALAPGPNGAVAFVVNADGDGRAFYNFGPIHNQTGFTAEATISGQVRPDFLQDWQVQPNLDVKVDVHQATIANISIVRLLSSRISDVIPGIKDKAVVALNNALALHDRLSTYWKDAYRTLQISAEPNSYVQFAPQTVQLLQPRSSGDGFLTAGALIDCSLSLFVGDRPSDPTPLPLPAPTIASALEPKFEVYLPVSASLTEISTALQKRLRDQQFKFGPDVEATINNIVLGSAGNKLLVRVTIAATESALKARLEGEITFEGVPVVSEDGLTLRFDQLDYTVDSKNELVSVAAWLSRPLVLQQVGTALNLRLDRQLTAANEAVNHELTEKFRSSEVDPVVTIRTVRASGIVIAGDKLFIVFSATGSCELAINL